MRSYVVNRRSHFSHSLRRRIESASLLSRESTTRSCPNPQYGHFIFRLILRHLRGERGIAGCPILSALFAERVGKGKLQPARSPAPLFPIPYSLLFRPLRYAPRTA